MARSENSGLIDLDALMREAASKEGASAPQAAPTAVEPAPTPVAVTPTPVAKAVPAPPPKAMPVAKETAPIAKEAPAPAKPVAAASVGERAPALAQVTPAPAAKAAPAPAQVTPAPAKEIPAAPSKMRSSDDSLEAVTTEASSEPILPVTPSHVPPPHAPASRRRPAIGIALALAMLAGGAVFLKSRVTSVAQQPQAANVAPTDLAAQGKATTPAAQPSEETPSSGALSASDLPTAAAPSASARPTTSGAPNRRADAPKAAATLTEGAITSAPTTDRGDLGNAMRGAVGANDAPTTVTQEATATSDAKQLHPSPGAVVGALGTVMREARACLGPDDPVRNGLVVFKSDGSVARVDIRGGKPEDDCVRAALSKAKVAPFVDDSFSTRVTVRP